MLPRLYRFLRHFPRLACIKNDKKQNCKVYRTFCATFPFVAGILAKERELQPPPPNELTHTYLIQNASIAAVGASTTLLHQITCSLIRAHEQYFLAVEEIIKLMELNLQVLGEEKKEEMVWDALLQIRADVNYWKTEKEDLEGAFSCAERSLEAAAETAHIAGAAFAGMAASERLFNSRAHLREVREKSERAEEELQRLEVETIKQTAEHAKKQREQNVAKDGETDEQILSANQVEGNAE